MTVDFMQYTLETIIITTVTSCATCDQFSLSGMVLFEWYSSDTLATGGGMESVGKSAKII
jgi:hypothetical protein